MYMFDVFEVGLTNDSHVIEEIIDYFDCVRVDLLFNTHTRLDP